MHGHLTETMFPFFYGIPSLKTCVPFPCFRFINPMSYVKILVQCSTHRDHSLSDFTVCPRRANNQMIRQTTTGLPNQYLSLFWILCDGAFFCSVKRCPFYLPVFTVYHTSKNFNLAPAATNGSCHIFRKSPYRGKNNNLDSLVSLTSSLFSPLPFTIHMDLNTHLKRALSSPSSPSNDIARKVWKYSFLTYHPGS